MEIFSVYEFKRLDTTFYHSILLKLQSFTIPPYNSMLASKQLELLIAIGVFILEQPVGLGIVIKNPQTCVATLATIYIENEHRNKGLATEVLHLLEKELRKEKETYSKLQTEYPLGNIFTSCVEKLIFNQGWQVCKTTFGGIIPNTTYFPWMNKDLRKDSRFEIFNWQDIKQEEKELIYAKQKEGTWFSSPSFPFWKNAEIGSLGLRFCQQLAGWIITNRLTPDTLIMATLFVDPSLQNTKIGLHLVQESIHLLQSTYPPLINILVMTDATMDAQPGWALFVRKKLLPFCTSLININHAEKKLIAT